jgi:uncharacterized repeat protein (TIGR01451 family)
MVQQVVMDAIWECWCALGRKGRRVVGLALVLLLVGWAPAALAENLQITGFGETPDPAPAGSVVDYQVTINNGGPETTTDAVVIIDLPAGATAINLPQSPPSPVNCTIDPARSTRVICVVMTPLNDGDTLDIDLQVDTSGMMPGVYGSVAGIGHVTDPYPSDLQNIPPGDPFYGNDSDTGNNVSTSNVTLREAGDLTLTKTATPDPVVAGGEVTYTITVFNAGPSASSNFSVTDSLPAGVTYVANSAQAQGGSTWTFVNQNGTFVGALGPNQSATYTFRAKVDVASGSVTNTATVNAGDTPDSDPDNNTGSATVEIAEGADLSIGKTANPVPALPGELITFTITVTNNGPSPAEGATWSDTLPAGFLLRSFVNSTPGWDCGTPAPDDTQVTCALPAPATLAVGESATFTVVALVPVSGPGSSGDMSNTATVSGSLPDPNTSNNSATVDFKVLPNGADLNLTKSKSPQVVPTWPGPGTPPAGSGYIIESTINVNNIGPAPVNSDLQVVDVLGMGEEYLPPTPAPWLCTATPYAAGTQQIVTCTLMSGYPVAAGQAAPPLVLESFAHPEAEGQPLVNRACTGGSGGSIEPGTDGNLGDPNDLNDCNNGTINPTPLRSDLIVTKLTNDIGETDNTLPVGYTSMVYSIIIRNDGPDTTAGIVMQDTLPGFIPGITTAAVEGPQGWTCGVSSNGTVTCESGTTTLASDASETIVVRLTGLLADSAAHPAGTCGSSPMPAGSWCNNATARIDPSVSGGAGEVNPGNNTGSDYVRVPRVSNVTTAAKTITTGGSGSVGVESSYRIDYRNEGPSLAPGVVFRDVFNLRADDPGFTLISAERTGDGVKECEPTFTGGVQASPGPGRDINVSTVGRAPGTLVLTCTALDMPGGQQQSMNIMIRPLDGTTASVARIYSNVAEFYLDIDGDGDADLPKGSDTQGEYNYNTNDTATDDEKQAVLIVGDGQVDLLVNKDDEGWDPLGFDPNDATGNFITYRVTVLNQGPSVASDVRITDTLIPAAGKQVRFVGSAVDPGGPFSVLRCAVTTGSNPVTGPSPLTAECLMPGAGFDPVNDIGVINHGATSTLYLRYQYLSEPNPGGDTLNNSVTAEAAQDDSNEANNTETETTSVGIRVDLAVSKRAVSRLTPPDPDPTTPVPAVLDSVSIREPFYWVVDAENLGPGSSLSRDRTGTSPASGTGTVITDTLPDNLVVTGAPITWQKAGPDAPSVTDDVPNGTGTCTQNGQVFTCNVGDVTSVGTEHGKVRIIIPVRWDVLPPGGAGDQHRHGQDRAGRQEHRQQHGNRTDPGDRFKPHRHCLPGP